MNPTELDQLVNAVLYEGHILYPYRAAAANNRRERSPFGRVHPDLYCAQNGDEPCVMQTECLLQCHADSPTLDVSVRFLHPVWREIRIPVVSGGESQSANQAAYRVVPEVVVGGKLYQTWQEFLERRVKISRVALPESQRLSVVHRFPISPWGEVEPIGDEEIGRNALMVRRQEPLEGLLEVSACLVADRCFKITVRLSKQTPISDAALEDQDAVTMRTFAATHVVLQAQGAGFISVTDPPANWKQLADTCENIGNWPVLVGDEATHERHTMLSSPIVLPDYPQVTPESAQDQLDGPEIDEMLELREMTMTGAEKRALAGADKSICRTARRARARAANDFWPFVQPPRPVASAVRNGIEIKAGDRVRIAPKDRADTLDLMLAGRTAIVESVEQNAEEGIHLAVVLQEELEKNQGLAHQSGHRFFYELDEVEPIRR